MAIGLAKAFSLKHPDVSLLFHISRTRKMPYYEHVRKERVAIQSMTKPLKMWLYRNKAHPYPTKADKMELAGQTKMTFTQVLYYTIIYMYDDLPSGLYS